MSSPAPFAPIAELLERSLSIRPVYGEPVHHGDTTVIPVARVASGFGAGEGRGPGRFRKEGLELGPEGTRFIHFHPLMPLLGAGALGFVVRLVGRASAMTSRLLCGPAMKS